MRRFVLATSLLALPAALAADCSGDGGANPYVSWAWDIRQAACGDGACNQGFSDNNSKNACNVTMPIGGGWAINWAATDSAGSYTSCWDASENLINQCFVSGSYQNTQQFSQGKWSSGSEAYTLTIEHLQTLVDYDPNDYGLAGETNNPPVPDNPAPPTPPPKTTQKPQTSSAAPPPSQPTYTCGHDCVGWVPNPDWCIANCPCFTAHSVC